MGHSAKAASCLIAHRPSHTLPLTSLTWTGTRESEKESKLPNATQPISRGAGLSLAGQSDTKDLTSGSLQPSLPSPSEATLPMSAVTAKHC